MRTTRHLFRHVLTLVGMGLMLAGLFGGPTSAADVEPFDYPHDWVAQNPWGPRDDRGQRDPWGSQDPWGDRYDRQRRRELGYGQPDHYTIHKGQKCEVQCTRIRGSREYTCREYRC